MEQMNMDKRALLITGTIVPNSNFVTHTDASKRRDEYYTSLLFYAGNFKNEDLFFLENSNYDFSNDHAFQEMLANNKITLLKFPVSDKFDQGKGYQEFEMLDAAADSLFGKYRSFIKITGRYKVLNLKPITDYPCKGLTADSHKKFAVTQTNVFYVNADFYRRHIKGLYKQVDDSKGTYIEKIVYQKIQIEKDVQLFAENPIITGISGSYGGTLNRNKTKMRLRNIERKVLRLFNIRQFLIEY
jgi:hypothetical protein